MGQLVDADRILAAANELCMSSREASCGGVIRARGVLAVELGNLEDARRLFAESLSFARVYDDQFLAATAQLNLGAVSLKEEHFDEASDSSLAAYRISSMLSASDIALVAQENLGWAYFNLGETEAALDLFLKAEQQAIQLGDLVDQVSLLTNAGYVSVKNGDYEGAKRMYLDALSLSRRIGSNQHTYNALRALALVAEKRGELTESKAYCVEAIQMSKADKNRRNELYPLLVEGMIAARSHAPEAEDIFREVERDETRSPSLQWRAQDALGHLYEDQGRINAADFEYRAAITTLESARSTVQHEDSRISFLTNGASLYDDYVHFLVANGKNDDALRWADFSRARTLSEGLGLLSQSGPTNRQVPIAPVLNPQAIAHHANGTLLFYWLGEKQSYLWAADSTATHLFTLAPRADIEAAVQRYRSALNGPQDVLEAGGDDGSALYQTLIAPAQSMLHPNAKVYIFPDGSLNNLNFETLIVPSPKPHYWIEDADVINASSLRILAASRAPTKNPASRLLLIGDSIAVGKDYPELPKAADQMASVAKHFPAEQRRIFSRDQANPAAYLQNNPEQFSNIHFVAHGTASRLSPLDSAIVLSGDADNPSSFKLYARDIVHHRLQADLVTISACYGAGERQYSGEGLVGLAWAFLYAGSHNVIAALWDVADASTYQLMDRFYYELSKGASPDAALRAAKLSLLRGNAFRNPFYWAPFQLYAA